MPFSTMLRRFLDPQDRYRWEMMLSRRARDVERGSDLVCEGDTPHFLYVVLAGWAQKYKQLQDGRRQIVGLFLPGDLCDLDALLVNRVDHNIAAVRDLSVAELTRTDVRQLAEDCPSLARLLFWSELAGAATCREWMINIGQRSAIERIAHLLCELYIRQQPEGAAARRRCDFFLTQSQIAEATGLTQVHVNRTLQELRARGLVQLRQRELHIDDFDELAQIAQFTGDYLHRDASSNSVERLTYFLRSLGSRTPVGAQEDIVELARKRA